MTTLNKAPILFGMLALLLASPSCNPEEEDLVHQSTLDQWTHYNTTKGLPSDNIISLCEGEQGRIWIGTDAGLSVYDGSTFTNYTTADGLLSNTIYAVLEDKDRRIWAGTSNGLNLFDDGKWLPVHFFDGAEVSALLELSNSDILIGTGGYGVYKGNYDKNTIDKFDVVDDCTLCNSIYTLYNDSNENVWIGSFAGARRIKGQQSVTFDKTNGLAGDIVTDFHEDSFGNIWVGCVEGTTASRISGNQVEQIYFSNGSPQNFIGAIEMDDGDNMWIGTILFGLYKYDGSFMGRVYEGPLGNSVRSMLKDRDGALWIGTTTGLARFIVGSKKRG